MISFFIYDLFVIIFFFFFQAEDGIRDLYVTGVQTCALPILDGMTFVDEATVYVKAGRGGNGSASMHSEPYKPHGGPDGGNGGPGGSVVFEVSRGVHDLSWVADHPHQRATNGAAG